MYCAPVPWAHNCARRAVDVLATQRCERYLYPTKCRPKMSVAVREPALQLDDHLKNLLRELGHAINDTVSESERITGAIAGVRAHGYDIVLKLDATIGLAKRDANGNVEPGSKLTTQDRRFLESLRIQVDQESFDQDPDRKPIGRLI